MAQKNFGDHIKNITKPLFKKQGFGEQRIITEWERIVGKEMAQYCLPERITFPANKQSDGVLHVIVDHGRALELQHLEPVILEKIAGYFGYAALRRISIMQAPVATKKKAETPPLLPTPKIAATVGAMVENIEQPEIKDVLTRLGEQVFLNDSSVEKKS